MQTNLNEHTLVLNKSWMPIATTTVRRALVLSFIGAARIVNTDTYEMLAFEDWVKLDVPSGGTGIQLSSGEIRTPDVIVLTHYQGVPKAEISFTRKNLLARDNHECQYCGVELTEKTMTIDHVLPSSKGGKTTWSNCVCSCPYCNLKKGDKLLGEADMSLRSHPREPHWKPYSFTPRNKRKKVWESFVNETMHIAK